MLEKLEKNIFFLAVSVVFLLFSLSLFIFKSRWGINDDVLMAMYASGKGFSNTPTEYLVYSNIIIGGILKKLYQAMPSFPLYGVYTFLILFISFVALLYSLLTYKYSRARIFYFFIYFALFGLLFIRAPQFTMNAFMVGMSGMFLFLTALYKKRTDISSKTLIIISISIFFLVLSSLIRIDSFFLVVILFSPFIFIEIAKSHFNRQIIGIFLIFSMSVSLLVFICHTYDKTSYLKDGRWTYQIEKAKLLAEMIDNNKMSEYSPRTKHIFDEAGWSRNDFILLGNWFSADDKVFSKEKMEKFLLNIKQIPTQRTTIHFKSMFATPYFYGAVLLVIFFIVQINEKKKKSIGIITSILVSLFLIIYLGYYVRLPERVYLSILAFLSFLALFLADSNIDLRPIKEWKEKFKLLFIILFIGYFLFRHYTVNAIHREETAMFKQYVAQLRPVKDRVFLVWAGSFPIELLSVFDNLDC